jgi:hypothetical protein
MKIENKIVILTDFTDSPGARYREDGDFSGQEFLEDILLDKFNDAVAGNYILLVDVDSVWGYPSSFISGSFGKLSIEKGAELVLKHLEIKSDNSKTRYQEIISEIKHPRSDVRV